MKTLTVKKNAFGLLKEEDCLDGVEFQKQMRDEWMAAPEIMWLKSYKICASPLEHGFIKVSMFHLITFPYETLYC